MINPIKQGVVASSIASVIRKDSESKPQNLEAPSSFSKAQLIKEKLAKGEYPLDLKATAEKMALSLLA